MAQLDQTQLAQIVSAVIQALQVQGAASTKPAPQAAGNSLEVKGAAMRLLSRVSSLALRKPQIGNLRVIVGGAVARSRARTVLTARAAQASLGLL
jgi:hypothetical protein